MDGSFDDRLKRLFGSRLFDPLPDEQDASPQSSLWSVACGKVERREWNRGGSSAEEGGSDDRENDPCASAFDDEDSFFAQRIKKAVAADREKEDWEGDLEDLGGNEDGGCGGGIDDDDSGGNREEREIRASIGLDPTLNREEEEDENDKRTCNSEDTGDRLFMRDVIAHDPNLDIHAVVPVFGDESSEDALNFSKDPRADDLASSIRLLEDDKAVENGRSAVAPPMNKDSSVPPEVKISPSDIKPILKRKGSQADPKPKKRVRFSASIDVRLIDKEIVQEDHMVSHALELTSVSHIHEESAGVPDYLRNPSKYTCYTLDWSEKDDSDINNQAFSDFLNLVKKANTDLTESSVEPPKSITFTSRKKLHNATMSVDNGSGDICESSHEAFGQRIACFDDVTAGDVSEHDECKMEKEETSGGGASIQATRVDRKYRSKSSSDDST